MKILIADHYGMCFGVRDALAAAEKLAQQGPLTILGELVHNPVVRDRLAKQGAQEGKLEEVGSVSTAQVMITAHGASDRAREAWRTAGFGVADGTCPLVQHAHEQLRLLVQTGYFPVVIGKRGHVEVNGLIGDFPEAVVLESEVEIAGLPPCEKFGVISQTTQPIERVRELVEAIRAARPGCEVQFRDTVCQPTKSRQVALRKLIAEVDTLVVVGGYNSNNTLQLVAAGKAAGRRVFHVQSAMELRKEWFADSEVIGVTAGTSTLKETVAEVQRRLEEYANSTQSALVQDA